MDADDPLLAATLAALTPGWLSLADRTGYVERQFRDELAAALAERMPAGHGVHSEHPAGLTDWLDVGEIDVAVTDDRDAGLLHAFELKWCKRRDKLNEALWDTAKLGLAVAVGRTRRASLLYAGPRGMTAGRGVGALLFAGGSFEVAELIRRFPAWWDWPVTTRPTRLPQTVTTVPAGTVAWRMRGGADWVARLLNVVPGPGWIPVVGGWPA